MIEEATPALRPVGRIGRYDVFDRLASGGMASVFLGRAGGQHGFAKWVAIKRPHAHFAARPELAEMFINEARIHARLEHENICPILDFDVDEHGPYIVLPFLHGKSLAALMAAWRRAPSPARFDLLAYVGAAVAAGLEYAARASGDDGRRLDLVHRDISPHNVFITFAGSVRILDFGVAKAVGFDGLTASGQIKGQFAYMSPEQARGERLDPRSDLFSLGAVLFEGLTHTPAFARGSAAATLLALAEPAPKVLARAPDAPAKLAAIVDRCLELDREDRFESAAELERALRQLLAERRAVIGATEVARTLGRLFADDAERVDPMGVDARQTDGEPPLRTAPEPSRSSLDTLDEPPPVPEPTLDDTSATQPPELLMEVVRRAFAAPNGLGPIVDDEDDATLRLPDRPRTPLGGVVPEIVSERNTTRAVSAKLGPPLESVEGPIEEPRSVLDRPAPPELGPSPRLVRAGQLMIVLALLIALAAAAVSLVRSTTPREIPVIPAESP